jgi:hypothetical protein
MLIIAALLALSACKSKDAKTPVGVDADRVLDKNKARAAETTVSGYVVTSVSRRTIGPFFSRRGSGPTASGMIAWLSPAEGAGRRVIVAPVGPNGAPSGGETLAGHASVDTTMLVVRPTGGTVPGFLLVWAVLTERGKALWSVAVNADGAPRSKPIELARTNDDIVWIDVLPTEQGELCVWAEGTPAGDANIVAASLDTDGKVRNLPARIARSVLGWHALSIPGGIGLSTVDAPDAKAKTSNARGGTLSFHRLDAEGRETAPAVVVVPEATVNGDVDVVRDGRRFVFAWTDRSATEPKIAMAALDDKNVVEAPRTFADPRGGASLLGLTSGPAGVAALFESPIRRKNETRRVHVVEVGQGLSLGRRLLSTEIASRNNPEIAATATGFAVLGTTLDCDDSGGTSCVDANPIATFFRTDEKAGLVQRDPFTFQTDPASLGWGLSCDGDTCFSLAASSDSDQAPSRIRTASIRPRANRTPQRTAPDPGTQPIGPSITDVVAIASGESVLDIAQTSLGASNLVALLTTRAGERGRRNHDRAEATAATVTISTRVIDENGNPSDATVLSTRALHVGGVAAASAEKPEDGGAIAWVARDAGDPEVHVTRIDKRGRRTKDVRLTMTKGDAANVTITWAAGGWLVAWVDSRNGNGEVYATKLSLDLKPISREERITNAPGDASDLVALASDDAVWLAWADPRESPNEGIADVFVTAVRMRDAKRIFNERRILPTAAHSRSPRLALGPNGVQIAWIEEAPPNAETPSASGYGAFWAALDKTGAVVERPAPIALPGEGAATAIALESTPSLRAVVARSTPNAIYLDAVDLSAPRPHASSLLALDGPPSLDVALVLDEDVLLFNDDGQAPADRRARRARITWPQP